MRYLTLSADYMEPSLRDHADGQVAVDLAGLSDDLVARLVEWNFEYQVIVPLDLSERRSLARSIETLDATGVALAAEIERALAPAKVTYYSEGWMRNL